MVKGRRRSEGSSWRIGENKARDDFSRSPVIRCSFAVWSHSSDPNSPLQRERHLEEEMKGKHARKRRGSGK